MADKVQKNQIADILLDFYDEYDSNVINRPMIPNIYAGKILDSLQKEPASKVWHDVSEEPKPNMELICVGQYGNPLVLSSNSNSFKKRYISKWAYFNDLQNLSNVQRTVKNWKEPVSGELEEAAHKYADIRMSNYETAFYAFMSGAKWQKEQMIAKAGNGRVDSVSNRQTRAHITVVFDSPRDIEVLDRLKVIVIKED